MKKPKKRKLQLLVISDVHLGTFGCRAKELLNYLKSVDPKVLVLNGDIVDIWQFNKRYFPKSHLKVITYIASLMAKGTRVYYITGNHDEMLRKFTGFELGNFKIVNKLVLELHGRKAWIFHGDVFDVTMKHSKWLPQMGGIGYDLLIMINTLVNWVSQRIGQGRISLSKRIKGGVKQAISFIQDFEETAAEIAISKNYDYVVCGHIHQPQKRKVRNNEGSVLYLNSGDWIENLTALEYKKGRWTIYDYGHDTLAQQINLKEEPFQAEFGNKQLFERLVEEFRTDSQANESSAA